VRADVAALVEAGADGILMENENDKPHTLVVSRAQAAWLGAVAVEVRRMTSLPLAIGVQRIDWETTLAVAAAADLQAVRLDTFVDRVVMAGEAVEVDPAGVRALRASLGVPGLALWTDVHVKHAELVGGGTLAASARRAVDEGAAAVLVTGTRTGEPPTRADLEEAQAALAGRAPVWIASGLDADNARALAPLCDGAIVGTALKTGARVDRDRARRVVNAWRA
jgi:membrane complex biogenesis BtpA family protein